MTSHSRRRVVARLFLVAGMVVGAGCVHVAPYEREDLARPGMDTERESAEMGFQAHVHDSREGATGGAGSTGGGCGCN
ncbi:MAG: DUF4266 domain-containing protein [Sandaracinus sp.]|nr:DUF4266 domain-containing protein [Sandaracinus sp.]MCB9616514.1 DUF4266 domain-containing protein [Sandaracinus sp.]MCB9635841.1 DUF4266 domain-containing protein [Sandaracinus sp.]